MNKIIIKNFKKNISNSFSINIDNYSFISDLYLFVGPNGSGKSIILEYLSGLKKLIKKL